MALPTASDNPFPSLLLTEGSAPASPAAGKRRLYVLSSDHLPYLKDSAGAIVGLATDPMTTRGDVVVRNASNVTARLAVGGAGMVLKSDGTDPSWNYQPLIGCKVYNSTTQSFNATTLTTITFDSEEYDTNVFHDTGSNTARLTAPITGKYCVKAGIWYATTSGTNYVLLDKNAGAAYIRGGATAQNGGGSGIFIVTDIALTAGDYITVVGYHTQAGSIATGDTGTTPSQQNWASMHLIGV